MPLPFLVLALWRAPSPLLIIVAVLLALPSPFVFYDVRGLFFNSDPQRYFSPPVSLLHHSWRAVPLVVLYGHWLALAWGRRSAVSPARERAPEGAPSPAVAPAATAGAEAG
jgi:hypothetical protein